MRPRLPVAICFASAIASCGVAGCSGNSSPASAPVVPPASWPRITLAAVAGGFARPVHIAHARDGSGRVFVVEQAGRIRILDNGAVRSGPFLDISARVLCCGEQGLLSAAFPPGFAARRHFYVNYTRAPDGATVVARYRVSADPDVADAASEEVVLTVPQPFSNHNGGQLAFGPDGYLYVGMGDGGGGGDPLGNAQDPGSLLGKILRIDVESGTIPYGVPADNPFVGSAGYRPEIWALGLRNPWRFSFDRASGDLYLGDVGQEAFEEIDVEPAGGPGGRNYGWNVMEGTSCFGAATCDAAGLTLPVATYDHSLGCSVTGGSVYRGPLSELQGIYFYGDFCGGRIWGLRRAGAGWDNAVLLPPPSPSLSVSTFGEDEEGNLYLANYANGEILKISSP